jgi:DNA-binding NarL/FixJ family response regulator
LPEVTEPLTGREREVLTLLADGLIVAAIARRWRVTERTVGRVTHSAYAKLGAVTAAQAVAIAIRGGHLDDSPGREVVRHFRAEGYQLALVPIRPAA